MDPVLVSAVAPVSTAHPTDPIHWRSSNLPLTAPVPVPCRLRIDDEVVAIDSCRGNGPYVVHLTAPLQRAHAQGAPVTVLDGGE
ncbi:hypothetical protein [Streptacidiphilus fuscans]|uniref:Uncharacterized protein n=1 Tax=Streptacidiphilus fuscans TaxID=2789292 RepID=A0A931B6J3_9ACTN|nr:hypothetical protein [Streptacidiphilus fuscans]MBF9069567.1 hypothetical protein [Streptacidiphilus fuscans]